MDTHASNVKRGTSTQKPQRRHRSDRLLSSLSPYEEIVILMHDNPDPDAIASGWALKLLIDQITAKPTRLVGGGAIVRAENRYLVRLLKPPIELIEDLRVSPRAGVILVDCGIQAANRLKLQSGHRQIVAVIDHHQSSKRLEGVPFQDIRPRVAASATITAAYLREQNLQPHSLLATALLYAMKTETRGSQSYFSASDRAIIPWLAQFADPHLLAIIEDSPLPPEYFGDMVLALQNTMLYGDTALCLLPRAQGAEIVGEVADLLIRCKGIHRVFCGAMIDDNVVVSVRTSESGGDASALVQEALSGMGHGGGHAHRAGGIIAHRDWASPSLKAELRNRWLSVCGVSRENSRRLISLDEIVSNL